MMMLPLQSHAPARCPARELRAASVVVRLVADSVCGIAANPVHPSRRSMLAAALVPKSATYAHGEGSALFERDNPFTRRQQCQ